VGTLCLTFDNMGRAREIAEGRASTPDAAEPGLAVGYPRLLALLAERGHEVGLHGWVHEKFAALDKRSAEQLLHDGTASLARLGLRPAGFRAPGGLRGQYTIPILRSLGYRYDSSTAAEADADGDEIFVTPGLLAPDLAHIPWRYAMVDSIQYLRHPVRPRTPKELESSWLAAIDRAAAAHATITLVIHAFVSGVDDERFSVVRRVLTHARMRGDIELTTAGALAERVFAGRN
jgi:peptidoglycan-N-acetylglucosamine deacetylase